jgi:hypothetical protein
MKAMFRFSSALVVPLILIFSAPEISAIAATNGVAIQRLWQPVRDDVYLQEVGRKITTSAPLTSVAVYDGNIFAGSAKGLNQLKAGELLEVSELREERCGRLQVRDCTASRTSRGKRFLPKL